MKLLQEEINNLLNTEKITPDDFIIPFSHEEYHQRLNRVRQLMEKEKIDLLFVSSQEGMCYFHGYQTNWYQINWPPLSGTAIHIDSDQMIHFDFCDEINSLRSTSILNDIRFYPDFSNHLLSFLLNELKKAGWLTSRVGLELSGCRPGRVISQQMEKAFISSDLIVKDTTTLLKKVMLQKSPREIEYIERAAFIVEVGHKALMTHLRPGVSELDMAAEVNYAMMKQGGEQASLILALRSGPLASFHGMPTKRIIKPQDTVAMDPCGVVNRYHANLARAYYLEDPPESLVKLYKLAGNAFRLFSSLAKADTPIALVNKEMRRYYQQSGIWELRDWVGGYGLGLSFPPDWVCDKIFTIDEEQPEGAFVENFVCNYESRFRTFLIDSFVIQREGAKRLTTLTPELIIVG
ncbi:MAG: Xaa-Pro peptidase family protein [Spirochaetota bacterium]